jgi:hypothetical protein
MKPIQANWFKGSTMDISNIPNTLIASWFIHAANPLSVPLSVHGYQRTEPAKIADVGLGVRF